MKVYIVQTCVQFEGCDIEGVFANKADAEKLAAELAIKHPMYDSFPVDEWEVK